jgi:hypothetical protein
MVSAASGEAKLGDGTRPSEQRGQGARTVLENDIFFDVLP